MPDKTLDSISLGHVYAQALINAAEKQRVLDAVTDDVQGLTQLLDKVPRFEAFAQAVTIGPEEKIAALEKMFAGRVNPLTLKTLQAMAQRDRLMFIRGFATAFNRALEKQSGRVDVEMTTAHAVPEASAQRIREGVGRALGKTVVLQQKTDVRLIGGLILRIDDTVMDGSVETRLQHMKMQMMRKAGETLGNRVDVFTTDAVAAS